MTFEQWWGKVELELQNRTGFDSFVHIKESFETCWNAGQGEERERAKASFPRITHTYTYAILEIEKESFNDISLRLEAAGYQDQFHDDDTVIDMSGIAIQARK